MTSNINQGYQQTSNNCNNDNLTNTTTQNRDSNNDSNHGRESIDKKLWAYFEQSKTDPTTIKCLLCSMELCNRPAISTLWNHMKIKHSIDKTSKTSNNNVTNDNNNHIFNENKSFNPTNGHVSNANAIHRSDDQNVGTNAIRISRNETNRSNSSNNNSMTRTHRNQQNQTNVTKISSQAKTNCTSSGLRRELDLIDYSEMVTSMKPLPSQSMSKNLISRLNLLSSPVTRKLKFWNKKSFQVNQYDPNFKVIYLGNLGMQFWSKDESCLEKPLGALWNNYLVNMKTEIVMRLTICNSGLKAITRQHGLTQYWSNRLVYCCSHKNYPKIFSWIYRHEGKKMRQELRCHAVFCSSPERAGKMVTLLNQRLACALQEFKREKKSCGPSIVTDDNILSTNQQRLPRTIPLRRQILAKGSANFRPPLERSKSAPKLTSIREEDCEYEDSHDEFEFEQTFVDKDDDDDDDDDDESDDYDGRIMKELDDLEEDSTLKIESNSLNTANEETSNSSFYASADLSFDNKRNILSDRLVTEPLGSLIDDEQSVITMSSNKPTDLRIEDLGIQIGNFCSESIGGVIKANFLQRQNDDTSSSANFSQEQMRSLTSSSIKTLHLSSDSQGVHKDGDLTNLSQFTKINDDSKGSSNIAEMDTSTHQVRDKKMDEPTVADSRTREADQGEKWPEEVNLPWSKLVIK